MKIPNEAFRVDDSGKIPEGAQVMSKSEIYAYQMRKIVTYQPRSDMYYILKANDLVVCGSAVSTLGVVSIFRKIFKIPKTKGSILTMIPVLAGSVVMASIMHGPPKYKIMLGNNTQYIKWRAGVGNAIAGGPISSLLGLTYCLGLRRRIDGSTYVKILQSANTRHMLYVFIGVTFLNLCAGYYLADQEINCLEKAALLQHKHLTDREENESTTS